MEAQLGWFLAAIAKKRCSLPPMPKQERHVLHMLAQEYGLATQSFGAEPNRYVDLFKVRAMQTWVLDQMPEGRGSSC